MKTNPVIERNEQHPSYTLKQLVLYFLRLGYAGFGGPVALVGYMHRDLVEERKWITEEEYKEGLTLAQLAPGPLDWPSVAIAVMAVLLLLFTKKIQEPLIILFAALLGWILKTYLGV